MLILLFTVSRIFLWMTQRQYPIKTTIEDHKYIFTKLINQNILVQTEMLFLIKLFIHMTVQHHISKIQLFFKE